MMRWPPTFANATLLQDERTESLSTAVSSAVEERIDPPILWAVAGLAAVPRLVDAWRRPFHTDERISLLWSTLPVNHLLVWLKTQDVHPPFFFLFLHFLGLASAPLWIVRLLMVALGTAGAAMLCATVYVWSGRRSAIVAGICAAFMPALVFYDTWVRMYVLSDALVLLEFLLLSLILRRAEHARHRRLLWACWALAAALAGYTLYLAWFAALAQILYVLCLHRTRWLEAATAFALSIVVWLPQVPALLHQLAVGGKTFAGYQGHQLAGLFALPAQAAIVPQLEGNTALAAAVFAWLWVAYGLWATLAASSRSLLAWLGMPALLTLAFGVASHKLIYLDRYYLLLAYALAAWTGCIATVAIRHAAALRFSALALAAGVVLLGSAYAVLPVFYTADWPGVAQTLAAQTKPGDLIIMEQGMPQWSMPGNSDIAGHPHLFLFWANQIPGALQAAQRFRRVWVMAYEPRGIDPNLRLLDGLSTRYHVAAAYSFNRWLPAEDVVLILFAR